MPDKKSDLTIVGSQIAHAYMPEVDGFKDYDAKIKINKIDGVMNNRHEQEKADFGVIGHTNLDG